MKGIKIINLALLLVMTLLFSCREDINIVDSDIRVDPPEIIINASVSGIVIDELGVPIEDALIRVGTNFRNTDENGVFIFKDIEMNEYGTLITAVKQGYFNGAKFVTPQLNKMSFTKFMLLAKNLTGNFSASTGGTVSANDGSSITVPSNSIMTANGSSYSGTVNVFSKWIDPSDVNAALQMPGDLRAIDGDNNFVQLATYGMVGVELESPSGEALQIADGSNATVEFPLPASIEGSAPTTIALWHFDESNGYWDEEGTATKQGDKYVANVSHFSFWNCDAPFPLIELTGSVVDANGNGVANVPVRIELLSNNSVGYGYTNEDGVFSGKVPKDELLRIVILDDCGVEIYSAEIGPFSEDTTLDPIEFSSSENTLTVTGNLEDCDNNPVSNGYVKVSYEGGFTTVSVEEDGTFSQTISICSATEVDITGIDIDNQLQSETMTYNVEGVSDLDVGTLTACDELEEFFTFTIDGGDPILHTEVEAELVDSMGGTTGVLFISARVDSTGSGDGSFISVNADDVGDYTPQYMFLSDGSNPNGNGIACQLCDDMTVSITALGDVGELIIGTFDGTIDSGSDTFAVSGSFKVIRDN